MSNDYYEIATPPASDPVTLAEAKAWCRVTHDAEDAIFTALISAVTVKAEMYTNRFFVTRSVTGHFASLMCSAYERGLFLKIRRSPLIDVSAIEVTVDGGQETVSTDDYAVKQAAGFSRVIFSEMNHSPDVVPYPWEIDFTAGYGAAADVPEPIKTAIKGTVAHWYANRGDCGGGGEFPGIAKDILAEYRIVNTYG